MTIRVSSLMVIPVVLILSACPVNPRSVGRQVGEGLKNGQQRAEQFWEGAKAGYSNPSATPSRPEPNADSVGKTVGRALRQGQKIAEQFLLGVKNGYQGHK
jgi:hypothetical protein